VRVGSRRTLRREGHFATAGLDADDGWFGKRACRAGLKVVDMKVTTMERTGEQVERMR
jgi:hypothetical protein